MRVPGKASGGTGYLLGRTRTDWGKRCRTKPTRHAAYLHDVGHHEIRCLRVNSVLHVERPPPVFAALDRSACLARNHPAHRDRGDEPDALAEQRDRAEVLAGAEPRLRTVVLVSGGLSTEEEPAEIDPFNFAPRITVPVLLIAGKDDFVNPLELSQKPLMRLLGSADKRHFVFDGGHVPPNMQEVVKETLDWWRTQPKERQEKLKAGISPAREAEVLKTWNERPRPAAGG